MPIAKEIDYELMSTYFSYDPSSPSSLVWNCDNGSRNPNTRRSKGEVAGSKLKIRDDHIVWQVQLKGVCYYAHRVVYVLNNGSIDSHLTINHIDCNPLNNLIDNLETCSILENNRKTKCLTQDYLMITNTSGKTGVREEVSIVRGKTYLSARAFCQMNGRLVTKHFSYNKYGKELAWKLAEESRIEFLNVRTLT